MEKKSKIIKKRKNYKDYLLILLFALTLGYAVLSSSVEINGNTKISNSTWDIHFANIVAKSGSVTIKENDQGATITPNKNTEVSYIVTLEKPGDFYEFNVDAVNSGTIDGMVNTVVSTIKIGDAEEVPITNESLPSYLSYSATYSDDNPIEQYHELKKGTSETYKIRVEFIKNIDNNELPGNDQTITISFSVNYDQADSHARNAHPAPNGVLITDSQEIENIKSTANVCPFNNDTNYPILNIIKITVPSNVNGQLICNNDEQLGLFKMCYNYLMQIDTLKKIGNSYEKINLTVPSAFPKKMDKLTYTSAEVIDYDYPRYEEGGGDREEGTFTISQSNLDVAGGELYIVLCGGAENYLGLTPTQVGQIVNTSLTIVN